MLTATRPEELFEYGNEASIKQQYRRLASLHHPDKGGTDRDFQKLNTLYEAALRLVNNVVSGLTVWDNGKMLRHCSGSLEVLSYSSKIDYPYGCGYVSSDSVVYRFEDAEFKDLALDAMRGLPAVKWPASIPANILPYGSASSFGLSVQKTLDAEPLRPVIKKGVLPVHAAWMTSRLMNMLCMLDHAGIMHGGLSLDNLFVDTSNHSLFLVGGWWYARKAGKKLVVLPAEAMNKLPASMLTDKIAETRLNNILVQQMAIELFGGKSLAHLRTLKDVPKQVVEFLASSLVGMPAQVAYSTWEKTLVAGFGPRKFVKFIKE